MFQGTPHFLFDVLLALLRIDQTDLVNRLDMLDLTEASHGVFVEVTQQWWLCTTFPECSAYNWSS